MSPQEIENLLKYIKSQMDKLQYNENLFEIREGDLLSKLEAELKMQLSEGESIKYATQRAAPINVLNKIISKLSKLYSLPPTRTTENSSDQDLIMFYEDQGINHHMQLLNEGYNSYKWSTLELYEDPEEEQLDFRTLPSHQFLMRSTSMYNPLKPTEFIKLMGEYERVNGEKTQRYWVYTKDTFLSVDSDGKLINEDMVMNEGENPYGIIPAIYVNKSNFELVPNVDSDTLRMTLIFPLLITDMNFGSMFLSLPILYGVDVEAKNLKIAPNYFWDLKSEEEGKTPTVGVLKPEPNLEGQMRFAIQQLSVWLTTRDIKPGTIGDMGAENFASGISKIISEMDTLENRKQQEQYFMTIEKQLWQKLAIMHNMLAGAGRIKNRQLFSDPETLEVNVKYEEQEIVEDRSSKVQRLVQEVNAGFISRESAIKQLNSDLDADEIQEEIDLIQKERTIYVNEQGVMGEEEQAE
jgi:hypothetical protein